MRAVVIGAAALAAAFSYPALARDPDGRYAQSPDRDWYLTRELTVAAQKRFGFKSCCARSDVVRTRFRPAQDGADGWDYLDGTEWKRVPSDIIHTDPAPGGEPVMFAVGGQPTCFFPPLGGI